MSRIAFNADTVHRIAPTRSGIAIEVQMTEAQMFDTVQSFLQHVPDSTWDDWKRRLDDDATSTHESFASDGSALS